MLAPSSPARAAGLAVELNKLEPAAGACRAYILLENGTGRAFSEFRLDLVMFDPDGIIAKRLAVDVAPLRTGKTSVRLFDIEALECERIDRVLVNDVAGCRDATGEAADCIDLVEPRSRAGVRLWK